MAVSGKGHAGKLLLNKFIITQHYRFKSLSLYLLLVSCHTANPYITKARRSAQGNVWGKMLAIIFNMGWKIKKRIIEKELTKVWCVNYQRTSVGVCGL